ncbi:MAG: nitrate- and nitrite sensing domain-containing protein [Ramlibacter sp.]
MKSGLSFLVAARQCEIGELEQLALTSELVSVIARLIHALQRERGLSNVYLASGGVRLADARRQQRTECLQVEAQVRQHFDQLDTAPRQGGHGARLFSRVAWVLHALDALPGVRTRVDSLQLTAAEVTTCYVRLITGLLAVVFEAADSAGDPEISRALVAMFNFMQGKEFAGQERAFGSAAFASGRTESSTRQQWLHLVESQERCLQVFRDYAQAAIVQAWLAGQSGAALLEIERLRRIGCGPDGGALDRNLSHDWFDNCTLRMDAMKDVEDLLAADLRALCERKIAQARAELRDQQVFLDALSRDSSTDAPAGYGPQLERSILGMVQDQAQRLQAMSDELQTVRAALNERKLVERAKGLLMATRKLSEEDAHKMLRQTAMSQNRRLVDVAETVLSMADYL